uniref:Uncharacterized protein n=1 Tax=Angiostrongylus cantonensis TaxID=6313 RepID=A0A0K0DCV2_ANGCA
MFSSCDIHAAKQPLLHSSHTFGSNHFLCTLKIS